MWNSIKNLIKSNNERFIIIEDGEPKYVIMAYSEYQQLQNGSNSSIVAKSEIESINGEMQDVKEGGLTLEDLPF